MDGEGTYDQLLSRARDVISGAEHLVARQQAAVARCLAEGRDSRHDETLLQLLDQRLHIFRQTYEMMRRKGHLLEEDIEILRQLIGH